MTEVQGTNSDCIFKFPEFSLSNRKFPLCQFTLFVTITYTKLTLQTYRAIGKYWKFSRQISQYPLPLESGNLQLELKKNPCVFPDRDFFWPFFRFSPCRGYPGGEATP